MKSLYLAASLALFAGRAHAQAPIALEGTVATIDSSSLALRNDDTGAVVALKLAPTWLTVRNEPTTLADIHPDDYVASAAVRGTDGRLHSTELRIFPPAMRGLGEGQRPMNDTRSQTMTNAVVTGSAVSDGHNTLKVHYTGGDSELVVDPGIPVTRIVAADHSAVTPGAKVRVQGTGSSPDTFAVSRVTLR